MRFGDLIVAQAAAHYGLGHLVPLISSLIRPKLELLGPKAGIQCWRIQKCRSRGGEEWANLVTPYEIRVPVSLLHTKELTTSAKLVWQALRYNGKTERQQLCSPTKLAKQTGLSRPTIPKAIAQLIELGWYALPIKGAHRRLPRLLGPTVSIPSSLIFDTSLSAQARLMYGLLKTIPDYMSAKRHHMCQFTYVSLSKVINLEVKAVRRAVLSLSHTSWLKTEQANLHAPIRFSLHDPFREASVFEVRKVDERIRKAKNRGEALMFEFLSLISSSTDYQNNARPRFMLNPFTDELMELDRYYPQLKVAFEFQGDQHYETTELYDAKTVAHQRGRDYMKMGICVERGITLIIIRPEDLTLATILKKVGHLLPLRDLSDCEPIVERLESISRGYRAKTEAARRNRRAFM